MEAGSPISVASLTGVQNPMGSVRLLEVSRRVEIAAAGLAEVRLNLPAQLKLLVPRRLPA
jgi:hypothetical protein